MKNKPILMEKYFSPGFKNHPSVHIGSQTLHFFSGVPEEQAWEGVSLAGASNKDIAVVRNIDPEYLQYWSYLMENPHILNLTDTDPGLFLTQALLNSKKDIEWIKDRIEENSNLKVFFPTHLEKKLANDLGVSLHGSPEISQIYGTKSGIRELAQEHNIQMAPGFICTTYKEIEKAWAFLKNNFEFVVIKHDLSVSGYYSKKLNTNNNSNIKKEIEDLMGKPFVDGQEIFVIEGWLKSKASLCAHIEILEGQDPIVCAGWQQLIDDDEISYIGAGPLMLSDKALSSFIREVNKLAAALKQKGAVGSFGPDFLITAEDEKNMESDICVLVELNARVPYTAFPLEIIKQVKQSIGSGFYTAHIKVNKRISFKDIKEALKRKNLLITEKSNNAVGVVPYNIGLLQWNTFDVAIMADSWEETLPIIEEVNNLFK